jgi:hypothetical protein
MDTAPLALLAQDCTPLAQLGQIRTVDRRRLRFMPDKPLCKPKTFFLLGTGVSDDVNPLLFAGEDAVLLAINLELSH